MNYEVLVWAKLIALDSASVTKLRAVSSGKHWISRLEGGRSSGGVQHHEFGRICYELGTIVIH